MGKRKPRRICLATYWRVQAGNLWLCGWTPVSHPPRFWWGTIRGRAMGFQYHSEAREALEAVRQVQPQHVVRLVCVRVYREF